MAVAASIQELSFASPPRRRVLAFTHTTFPHAAAQFAYEWMRNLGDRLDAETRFAHTYPSDPTVDREEVGHWRTLGLLLPDPAHTADACHRHFTAFAPQRLARLLELLAERFASTPEAVVRHPAVASAITQARWVQAWAPDLICTAACEGGSLAGFVAASLLGIPRVHFQFPEPPSPGTWPVLDEDLLQTADVLALPDDNAEAMLTAAAKQAFAHKTVAPVAGSDWLTQLAACTDRMLRRHRSAQTRTDLGSRAAFAAPAAAPATAPAGVTPFVIVCTARTGSNLLVELLDSHLDVLVAGELFNPVTGAEDQPAPPGFVTPAEFRDLRQAHPALVLQRMYRHARDLGKRATGFKLFYEHANTDDRIVSHLRSLPNLRVLHLTRRDRIARYVSYVRAEASGSWYAGGDKRTRGADASVTVEPARLLADCEITAMRESRARATFADRPVLEVVYEDLAADAVGVMRRVLDFLGVPPSNLHALATKTGESDVRRMIANWETLQAAFLGTRWGHLFDRVGPAR